MAELLDTRRNDTGLLKQIKYHILRPASPNTRDLQHQVYAFWKALWRETFAKVGRAEDLNPDDFFRQDLITALVAGDKIVACHLYTHFDLEFQPAREHSYFGGINPETLNRLVREGYPRVMSMEYMSVHPDWRKSKTGVPFGEVLLALGMRLLPFTSCDAALGTGRVDIRVDQSGLPQGFVAYQDPIEKYNYQCRLMVCPYGASRPHPDPEINGLVQRLWSQRVDETGLTQVRLGVAA